MLNKPLLRKVMEKIDSLPSITDVDQNPGEFSTGWEAWDQTNWFYEVKGQASCGTAGCFAGWTAHLDGAKPSEKYNSSVYPAPHSSHLFQLDVSPYVDGVGIARYAKVVLGLSRSQSSELFAPDNTRGDLRRIVNELLETEE